MSTTMSRSQYSGYGVSGTGHKAIIDRYLDSLPDDATILYPGCGGGTKGELLNFTSELLSPSHSKRKKLILVDISATAIGNIRGQLWGWPGHCRNVVSKILELDVMRMSGVIAEQSIDLVLALGLFGGLLVENDSRIPAFQAVLSQTFRVLKGSGLAIIGNSCDRQPVEQFIALSQQAGFRVLECTEPRRTVTPDGGEHPDLRYLLVLLKQ
jgi:hypothetical protein